MEGSPAKSSPITATKEKESPTLLPYVCVHCGAPCTALYRHLSVSLSSIKAMQCEGCDKVVDPYVEQEPLLVAIDCILSRTEAYRHVLYNEESLKTVSWRENIQLLAGWAILEAYLKWQATTTEGATPVDIHVHQNMLEALFPFALTSLIELFLQWFAMQAFQTEEELARGSRTKLYWALFLPCSFTVVTSFVSIWENTKTVRMLATLLISYWQGTATWVVTNDLSTPMLCILTGVLWRLILPSMFPNQSPCFGHELEVFQGLFCIS